jgi:hypothetical protein
MRALHAAIAAAALVGCSRHAPTPPVARVPDPRGASAPAAAPGGCPGLVTPASAIVPAGGATRSFTVRVAPGCAWTMEGATDAVRPATPADEAETNVAVTIAPNPGAGPRELALRFGGRDVRLFQDGRERLVHPRIWLDPARVEALGARATPSNPAWVALERAIAKSAADFDARFPARWRDNGGVTFTADASEAFAELFAFASLVAKTPEEAKAHAARARALVLHVVDEANKGPLAGAPFRDPQFACYDRSRWWGEGVPLAADWIARRLSDDDLARVRRALVRWAGECTKSFYAPWNVKDDRVGARNAANNYYLGHLRNLTLGALAIDPALDPPIDPSRPREAPGNSLAAYLHDATDSWLRLARAAFVDGDAAGGLPVEGWLYGPSVGYLSEALEALDTAGVTSPHAAAIVSDRYWDDLVNGFLSHLEPAPRTIRGAEHVGRVYGLAPYGDLQRTWALSDWVDVFGSMGAIEERHGGSARLPALRWLATEALPGGADKLAARIEDVAPNSSTLQAIRYFLLLDPDAPKPTDPRPLLPLEFASRPMGRMIARTDWSPEASLFTFHCSWLTIAHQPAACGAIGLYRAGEWLTSERVAYSVKNVSVTSDYKNTLSIENDHHATPPLEWFEAEIDARGSQRPNGTAAGDPRVVLDPGDRVAFAEADATPLYNRVGRAPALDVTHASRSVVWLAPDRVVVYDRAATGKPKRFKRWNLMLPSAPTIQGATAIAATPGGQRLFVTRLLPASATMVGKPSESDGEAEGDTMRFRLVVEDPSGPRETRFLHVLEGGGAGARPEPAEIVRSTAGPRYEGAATGEDAVLFPVDLAATAATTPITIVAPTRVGRVVLTGLAPNAGYDVARAERGGSIEITVRPGDDARSDAAGLLVAAVMAP